MAEHGARYARLAAALNRAGCGVWAHDHRGHGLHVTGPAGHFADAGGWRAIVDDTWAVSAALQAAYPGVPLVLFAHSMGSFVGQALMGEHGESYHAVILSGSNGPPGVQEAAIRTTARLQRLLLGARAPGVWLQRIVVGTYNRQFAPARTDVDWLSRDPSEVDAYVADPSCGAPLTSQAWVDFLEGKALLGDAAHLRRIPKRLPVHLIAGTRDPVGENGRGVRRLLAMYEAAGLSRVSLRLYEEARHELVNEVNRDQVVADLVTWLDQIDTRP
jgi:alpha-beta hydrolase superfamily lysophospholipase